MKKFLKKFVVFISGVFGFLVVLFYFFLFAVTGTEPLTQIARGLQNKCDIDLKKDVTVINFVERQLYLPSKHIAGCYPVDMSTSFDYDPASVSLVGILPGFTVPDFKPGTYLEYDDEIRIHFTGSRPDISKIDPMIKLGFSDLEKSFQALGKATLNLDGQKIAKYEDPVETDFGLIFYKTRATGTFAKDMYVHKNADGKIDFMVECYNKDKKPTPRVLYCSSVSESLYDNVSFKYGFTLKHISHAAEIDKLVKTIVHEATTPK